MGTTVIIILTCLLLSAFFSGMEIAFLSSNKLKLEIEKKQGRFFSRVADLFTRNPGQYITTLLVGNNIALVVYSLQMTVLLRAGYVFYHLGFSQSIVLETVVSTMIIIFFAEFIPKAMVRSNPNFYFHAFYVPVYFFYLILYPVAKFSTALSRGILRLFGMKAGKEKGGASFDKVDLAHLVEEASAPAGTAAADQKRDREKNIKLFQNALEFPDLQARDCMVPRVDIEATDIESSIEELQKIFVETRYSRIPVYEGSIDRIVGYVNSKSLFNHPATVREVVRPLIYVPESMEIQRLLANVMKNRSSITVVIDEFGGTAGMITIEDILEEIFGEIEDEHDSPDLVEKRVGDNQYVFSCRLEVDYLNDTYGLDIPESEEYDTLAGFILFHHEGLPAQGEELEIGNKTIKVLKRTASRIDLVKLTVRE
ncbi:MAG: hemolysin family protein [Rikenellaceae bacterium]|jgi:CBS domain containing-hemolysin-like protein|nr:hemolysin family protein [Rikenellaceae bacterium]